MSMERAVREKQITMMVKLYYVRCPFLQYEPLDQLIERALNKYLDTDLTIEQINDSIADAIRERRNNVDRDTSINTMLEEEQKEEIVEDAKQKVLTTDNEEGFVSNMIVTTLALITFSLSSIGLILLYLLKS